MFLQFDSSCFLSFNLYLTFLKFFLILCFLKFLIPIHYFCKKCSHLDKIFFKWDYEPPQVMLSSHQRCGKRYLTTNLSIALCVHHSQTIAVMEVPDFDCTVSPSGNQPPQCVIKRHGSQIHNLKI